MSKTEYIISQTVFKYNRFLQFQRFFRFLRKRQEEGGRVEKSRSIG